MILRLRPRLYWLTGLVGVCLILLLTAQITPVTAAAGGQPDHITLTWLQNPQTTQTITWRTDSSISGGQVRLSPNSARQTSQYQLIQAVTKPLQVNTGEMNLHSATLTGLKPGSSYSYQVGYGSTWSHIHQFRTAPLLEEPFKFLIMGDSQSIDYDVWRTTLRQAAQSNPDAAFFVSMGDLVDVGQDYTEWEAWFAATAGVMESLPILPIVGNHECYTPQRHFSRPEYFTAQFNLPQNGPSDLAGQVYSFDYGDVHLVILDSQAGEQARFLPDMLEQQRLWLEADLAATTKRWKLVFMHRPIYGNKTDGIHTNLRRVFEPVFDRHRVDVVFTAHDHVYAHSGPFYDGGPLTDAQSGTLHVATGRTGTKTYSTVAEKPWNNRFFNPVNQPIFLSVTVDGATLRIGVFGQNGELLDSWELIKPTLN